MEERYMKFIDSDRDTKLGLTLRLHGRYLATGAFIRTTTTNHYEFSAYNAG